MGAVPPKRNCTLCNTLTLNTFHLPEIIVAALQSCNITLCILTANYCSSLTELQHHPVYTYCKLL